MSRIQNQTGLHPLKWGKTGVVVEVRQFDQYVVRVNGSERDILRNRKFLRKYIPVHLPAPRLTIDDDIGLHRNSPHSTARPLGHSEVPGLPPLTAASPLPSTTSAGPVTSPQHPSLPAAHEAPPATPVVSSKHGP